MRFGTFFAIASLLLYGVNTVRVVRSNRVIRGFGAAVDTDDTSLKVFKAADNSQDQNTTGTALPWVLFSLVAFAFSATVCMFRHMCRALARELPSWFLNWNRQYRVEMEFRASYGDDRVRAYTHVLWSGSQLQAPHNNLEITASGGVRLEAGPSDDDSSTTTVVPLDSPDPSVFAAQRQLASLARRYSV